MLMGTMPDAELLSWPERLNIGDIGVLTLDGGEQMTAEVLEWDEERDELLFRIVSSSHSRQEANEQEHAVPSATIISFAPQSRDAQPWPYSDPCRSSLFSWKRFVLMTTLFLSMTVGSFLLFLFFLFTKWPYGLQMATAFAYTLVVLFLTFAATKNWPHYLFTCPAVRTQISTLALRHICLLVGILWLQTTALSIRTSLPAWWNTQDQKGRTPFEFTLMLLLMGFAWAQVLTNRSTLKRAHQNFSN